MAYLKISSNFKPSEKDAKAASSNPSVLKDSQPEQMAVMREAEISTQYYKEASQAVSIRDQHFNTLLFHFCNDYKERAIDKRWMKKGFCISVLATFTLLIVSVIALPLLLALFNSLNATTFIASMVTSLAGIISAVLTLPQVIAEYLFDPQEDEKFLELIKNMQQYNTLGHERLEHHNSNKS